MARTYQSLASTANYKKIDGRTFDSGDGTLFMGVFSFRNSHIKFVDEYNTFSYVFHRFLNRQRCPKRKPRVDCVFKHFEKMKPSTRTFYW